MTRRPLATLAPVLVSVVLAALVSGCVRVPDSGPVVETRSEGDVSSDTGFFYDPKPPQSGAAPAEIVRQFLIAMQAVPVSTKIAREFLTEDAAASWTPQRETITYPTPPTPTDIGQRVSIQLPGANHLDSRRAWRGALPRSQRTITFDLTLEDGEWRIDDLPDALIVPQDWFQRNFRQVSLYYFDPTAAILTPEPVFVPRGDQLPSTLTQALLAGPSPGLSQVIQSFIPAGLEISVGVTISDDGVADILLSGDGGQPSADTIEKMLAQLAWTLRQEPTVKSIQLSFNGEPVPLPGGVSSYRVDGGAQYDPAGVQASPLLYGLRRGIVVSGTPTGLEPVGGPLGEQELGMRSIGVSLDGSSVAGIGADGTSVLLGQLGSTSGAGVETVVSGGQDFLKPAWDFAGRIWLVDRTTRGARVSYVEDGAVRRLWVPGISGERVRAFLVSRDGSRLVAVIGGPDGDTLMLTRIEHRGTGKVVGATRAMRIGASVDSSLPIRAISWRSASSVVVLNPPVATSSASVATASVDGSPPNQDPSAIVVDGVVRALVGSPAGDEPVFGLTRRGLIAVDNVEQRVVELPRGTSHLVYVG
ncbi:LpqB family beta-propeller domain-containing protein [Nocardioides sp.]|uniref:LpqB family beta-propeller domain-containing protein n=1 Tax=Nocardioides sp. TaxID=35761 RepID=UPI002600ED1F|nr:LpqB family beta-propeller domain-containing protein [Nocardioides sp.]